MSSLMKTFDAKWESSCFSFHSPKKSLAFLLKMENKITTIAKKLDELVSTKGPRGCVATTSNETVTNLNQVRETDSFPNENSCY